MTALLLRKRKVLLLANAIVWSIVVGAAADFLDPSFEGSVGTFVGALIVSPFSMLLGAGGVSYQALFPVLAIGGFLYFPVGAALSVAYFSPRVPAWGAVVLFLWSTQGFFQIMHRFLALAALMEAGLVHFTGALARFNALINQMKDFTGEPNKPAGRVDAAAWPIFLYAWKSSRNRGAIQKVNAGILAEVEAA